MPLLRIAIMRVVPAISIGALTAGVFAQSSIGTFEEADFNITEALIGNGVDVSAIPELSGLVERTLDFSPCAIAVSCTRHAQHVRVILMSASVPL